MLTREYNLLKALKEPGCGGGGTVLILAMNEIYHANIAWVDLNTEYKGKC